MKNIARGSLLVVFMLSAIFTFFTLEDRTTFGWISYITMVASMLGLLALEKFNKGSNGPSSFKY